MEKIFVNDNKTIHVSCPKCGHGRNKDVSKYLDLSLDQAIQFKYHCPCGHSFSLQVERRRYVRKKVNFKGTLIFNRQKYNIMILDILVLDISRYGLKIKLVDKFKIEKGQRITINFQLDDKYRSKVSKEAVVKNLNFPTIGVEFLSHNHYDKFGAYILFYFNDI